jgi:hypothetical protein
VEELEHRQLLSVALLPGHLNLKTVHNHHAVMTVRVVGDTTAGANLIKSQQSLVVNVVDASGTAHALGTPLRTRLLGTQSGTQVLVLKFRRNALDTAVSNLTPGTSTLQVTDGTAADTETANFTVFSPGGGHHRAKHHGRPHG